MLLGVALLFVGFVFYALQQTEPVKVLRPRLQRSGASVYLTGALENTGPADQVIDLEIRYYDSNGHQVATDTVKVDHLGAGETRNFASPARQLPGVSSYSIYLNHGRNPYGN